MPSTITITTALRDACAELLSELATRAEVHAIEVDYHVVSAWATALLNNETALSAAAIAAQHEFTSYPVNVPWLDRLDDLIIFGGDGIDDFMVTLCRYYLFNLPQIEETVWQQYSSLRQSVMLETSRQLPETWGEWDRPMQSLFQSFEEHLCREEPNFGLLLSAPTASQLMDVAPIAQLPPGIGGLLGLPSGPVDDTAALTSYLEWCAAKFGILEANFAPSGARVGLRLEDIFVPRSVRRYDDWTEIHGYVRYQLMARRNGYHPHEDIPSQMGTISQLLSRKVRLLVLAGPGGGKTTLLRHLAFQHANIILKDQTESSSSDRSATSVKRIPIYLHAAEYAEKANVVEETLIDYTLRALAEDDLRDHTVPDMLRRAIEDARCVFLIDGLDAVQGDYERRMVSSRVRELAETCCGDANANRLLVASRLTRPEVDLLASDFFPVVLSPLDSEEIGDLLVRWALATERANRPMLGDDALTRHAEQTAIGVLREISRDNSLRNLAANPLMLRIMAERHMGGDYLSPQQVGLLRSAADAMLREWRLPRGPTHQPQVLEAEVTDLLSHLAYWIHDTHSSGEASEHQVAEQLLTVWLERHPEADEESAHEAIADFLAKIRHHGGLLAEVRPRRYGFTHPLMEEYFAARYLVARYRTAGERIRQHLHDPRWEHVIRLAIGFVSLDSPPDASDLLEMAVLAWPGRNGSRPFPPTPFEDLLRRDLLFAASLLGDGIEASPHLMQTIVQQVVDLWLLGDRDHVGRFDENLDKARRVLCRLDGKAAGRLAFNYALTFLEDERPPVRTSLADALTFWPSLSSEGIPALVELGRDQSPVVRRAAAEALGRVASLTSDAHVLLLSLVSDSDQQVREVARRALQKSGQVPETALKVWLDLLHDEDPGRRQLGARVLQRVGSLPPLVIGELLSLLSDEDQRVRRTVANTLSNIEQLPDDDLFAIARAIDLAESDVKVAAIEALARPVELPDSVLTQVLHWSRDANPQVRFAATRVLYTCKNINEPVMDALMNRTGDDASNVRQLAIEALGQKGADNPRVEHILLHFTAESNPGVKISTARALGHLGSLSPEAQDHLAQLLTDFHAGVREAAMDAVARLGQAYERAVSMLMGMTRGDNQEDALMAARTLASLDGLPPEALVALVGVLPRNVEGIGDAITRCLSRHSPLPAQAIHPLVDLSQDAPSSGTRAQVIGVLGRSLHVVPHILETLLERAEDSDEAVRVEALASLRNARAFSDRALDKLFEMLDEPSLEVRRAAAVTLAKLSQTLPHLDWDERRLERLTDTLYRLLDELPPRASWEPDTSGQNDVFEALTWMATRYGPEI